MEEPMSTRVSTCLEASCCYYYYYIKRKPKKIKNLWLQRPTQLQGLPFSGEFGLAFQNCTF